MRRLAELSLRGKLTALILLASGVGLALACTAFIVQARFSFRADNLEHRGGLIRLLAASAAPALEFDDQATATDLLSRLAEDDGVDGACIYDAEGKLFATFERTGADMIALPATPPPAGHRFTGQHLEISRAVLSGGKVIGALLLRANEDAAEARFWRFLGIAFAFLLGALALSYLLSQRFSRWVSDPILALLGTVRAVAATKDYSLRSTVVREDEVGQLVGGFNSMLAQIESRDRELGEHRDNLEKEVVARTSDIRQMNDELILARMRRRPAPSRSRSSSPT
ncbi:MAG: HAMP domain-containing protein [Planctomycetes bacterium]|nr:HAMP domain-containing protein [Planctomycetota bacterium]